MELTFIPEIADQYKADLIMEIRCKILKWI